MTPAAHFPAVAGLTWVPVAGGFSGARVWRGGDPGGLPRVALKSFPAGFTADRLRQVHRWMASATLAVVPAVFRTATGDTVAEAGGNVWECVGWVPGEPLLGRTPTRDHGRALPAACAALAALHRSWLPFTQPVARPPCIARRRELFAAAAPHVAQPPAHLNRAAGFLRTALPAAVAAN